MQFQAPKKGLDKPVQVKEENSKIASKRTRSKAKNQNQPSDNDVKVCILLLLFSIFYI